MKADLHVAALLIASSLLAGCGDLVFGPPPGDEQMLQTFHEKRNIFDELVARMCKDGGYEAVMMSPERARPEIGEAEKQEFYRLFREIGAKGIQAGRSQGECGVSITVWMSGSALGGDSKGYYFGPVLHGDKTVWLASLDEVDRRSMEIGFFARRIEDGWSLYFNHWP